MSRINSLEELNELIARGGSKVVGNPLLGKGRSRPKGKAENSTVPTIGLEAGGETPSRGLLLIPGRHFVVQGNPVPKPRQTRSDKWNTRPCVVRYREWADLVRECAGVLPLQPESLRIKIYIAIPKSWNTYKREFSVGKPHRYKPDTDNFLKAVVDALYPKGDEMIYDMSAIKFWDDGQGPRVEVQIWQKGIPRGRNLT